MTNASNATRDVTRVFVSYSRSDTSRIQEIADGLSESGEFQILLDQTDIMPGEVWKPRLEKMIRGADAVVFAVSPRSISSAVCQWELNCAHQMNKRIVPIVVEEIDSDIPEAIGKLNFLFATSDRDQVTVLAQLKATLLVDIEWLREHTRLGELAARWEEHRKLGAQPLRGRELDAAEKWLSQHPRGAPAPTDAQRIFIYDSRKFVARRQRWTMSGALATTMVVAVLAVFAWTQRSAAINGQEKAEAALREANRAANTMTYDLASRLGSSRVPRELVRSILEKSLELQESLSRNFPEDIALRRTRVDSQIAVGLVLERQNDHAGAEAIYEDALANAEILAMQPGATSLDKSFLPSVWLHIGSLQMVRNEWDKAETSLQRGVDLYYKGYSDDAPIWYHESLSETLGSLGTAQMSLGNYQQADSSLTKSLDILRGLKGHPKADFDTFVDLPQTLSIAAEIKLNLGDDDSASALREESLETAKENFAQEPHNGRAADALIVAYTNLADFRRGQADWPAAEALYLEAYGIASQGINIDPNDTNAINRYIVLLDRLSGVANHHVDHHTAASRMQEVLNFVRTLVQKDPDNPSLIGQLRYTLSHLGSYQIKVKDFESAILNLEESLSVANRMAELELALDYHAILGVQELLVNALRHTGQYGRARVLNAEIRKSALQLLEDYPSDILIDSYLAVAAATEGRLYIDEDKFQDALPSLVEAVTRFKTLHERDPLTFGRDFHVSLNELAEAKINLKLPAEALAVARDALELIRAIAKSEPHNDLLKHDEYASLRSIAVAQEELNEVDASYNTRLEAIRILKDLTERHPSHLPWQEDFILAIDGMGMLLFRHSDYERAAIMFEEIVKKADQLLEKHPKNNTITYFATDARRSLARSLAALSDVQLGIGDFGQAVNNAKRALDYFPSSLIIKSYLANAYMVNGNTDQARNLFLSHRGQTIENGRAWEDVVRSDFEAMRKKGVERPLMDEVLAAFDAPAPEE